MTAPTTPVPAAGSPAGTAAGTGSGPDSDPGHRPTPGTPTPWRALRHGCTLGWRQLTKIVRNPEQLLDVTLMPIMFVVLFVFIFGGAIGGDWRNYLQYVLPGLLVQSLVFATLGTGTSINTDIDKGIFDRFRALPIARSGPLIGAVLGDLARYTISVIVLVGFAAALGYEFVNGLLPTVLACLLVLAFALCLSWVWVWLGVTMRKPTGVQGAAMLLLFPLTFGSNVFVETETMPAALRAFADVNPVSHLAAATRGLMLDGPVAEPLAWTAVWGIALLVVFVPLALRGYRRRT